jgi:hypothetical protein
MSQENVEIVRAAIDAHNRGDVDGTFKDAAPDFQYDQTQASASTVARGSRWNRGSGSRHLGLDVPRRRLCADHPLSRARGSARSRRAVGVGDVAGERGGNRARRRLGLTVRAFARLDHA